MALLKCRRLDNFRIKICASKDCENEFRQYNSLVTFCSPGCKNKSVELPKKKNVFINKVSDKKKVENLKYIVLRKEFLGKEENRKCFIEGCNSLADTIEHTRQRIGYADQWARDNGISLFLDTRYWKPCCLKHNLELENNPELAAQYKLSKFSNEKRTLK